MSLFRRSLMSAVKKGTPQVDSVLEIKIRAGTQATLGVGSIAGYNNLYEIDWGDGTVESGVSTGREHMYNLYTSGQLATVKLTGRIEGVTFKGKESPNSTYVYLTEIVSFGTSLKTMDNMFKDILTMNSATLIPKCYSTGVTSMNNAFGSGYWEISQGAFELLTKCDFSGSPFETVKEEGKEPVTYKSYGANIYLQGSIFPATTELPKLNLRAFFRNCTIKTPIPENFLSNIESPVILDQMFNGAGCAYDLPEAWLPENIDSMNDFMGDYTKDDSGKAFTTVYDANFVGDMEEVWNRVPPPPHNSNSLKCTTLANYADIPAEWGGAEEE